MTFPMVWPMPTPMAIGIGPATADTWEAITYASALASGSTAESVPNPMDVSSASSSAAPHGSIHQTVADPGGRPTCPT